jgi:hypothetical protein
MCGMPYAIDVFDRAWEDLAQLLEEVPISRWDAIGEAIEGILARFAQAPTSHRPPLLVIPLHFTADEVQYRWQAAWQYGQDEQTIHITAFGRDPYTIL